MSAEPLKRYRKLIASGSYLADAEQLRAVQALNELHAAILRHARLGWWRRFRPQRPAPPRGLYLCGGVGRGKTWLMDLFYESLPLRRKQRLHFHRFMARIHEALRERTATADPLPGIARQWARECRVLCLDEFFVADIADAMLLSGLLGGFFDRGVVLVATSNTAPRDLYRDGLQRARFLPAIDLLEHHMRVLHVGGDTDYRLRLLERSEIYHTPLDADADASLEASFERMAGGCELETSLFINHRPVKARRRGDGIIWFDYPELCQQHRSTGDYIEIARAFNTVLLSNVPVMNRDTPDAARRFVNLVDEFYDRNVKLLLSAAAPPDGLYGGGRLDFEFERTRSRLIEMQSHDYLARPHLP